MGCGSSMNETDQFSPKKIDDNLKLRRQQSNKVRIQHKALVQKNDGKLEDDYTLMHIIGEGHYGVVKKVIYKLTGEERAVKIIKKNNHNESTSAFYEIDLLRSLDHPHILKIFEFYEDKNHFYVVMELLQGGELFEKISEGKFLDEQCAQNIIKQVLSAIYYAHTQKIMHRDLKPENILLEVYSNNLFNIKVIDWGGALRFQSDEIYQDYFGTRFYMSPEQHLKKYNYKCDLWSVGVILYILISGESPFGNTHQQKNIINMKYQFYKDPWEQVSEECIDLIKKLMCSQENRLTAQQALTHTWFSKKLFNSNIDTSNAQQSLNKASSLNNGNNHQNKGELMKNLNKLKQFQSTQKFQVTVLNFIAFKMISSKEYNYLRDQFKEFDLNGDGTLTKQEIQKAYEQICSKKELKKINLEEIITQIDIDNNGVINFTEFISATMDKQNALEKDKLKIAFNYFDQNKNGYITKEELYNIIGSPNNNSNDSLGEQSYEEHIFSGLWQLILDQSDQNKDGQIEFDEFENMMNLYAATSDQQMSEQI